MYRAAAWSSGFDGGEGRVRLLLAESTEFGNRVLDLGKVSFVAVYACDERETVLYPTELVDLGREGFALRFTESAVGNDSPSTPRSVALQANAVELVDVPQRIRESLRFMEAHLHEPLPLQRIARVACVSTWYYSRLFRAKMGTTCSKYLAGLRIREAQRLLRTTDLSVTQVCYQSGFNDLTHFERMFRRVSSTTPSEFRRRSHP